MAVEIATDLATGSFKTAALGRCRHVLGVLLTRANRTMTVSQRALRTPRVG